MAVESIRLPPYQEQFPVGSQVRVKARPFLERFQREWKYHHPISADQIDAAGKVDTVTGVGFYHGGDVLYQLSQIPRTWHEVCLESSTLEQGGFSTGEESRLRLLTGQRGLSVIDACFALQHLPALKGSRDTIRL